MRELHLIQKSRNIAMRYGKLYYRSLERCKTKSLIIFKGNFDKNNPRKQSRISYCEVEHNMIVAYGPIVTKNPSSPKTLKYWVGVQWGQSYLMGRRCLFSLD